MFRTTSFWAALLLASAHAAAAESLPPLNGTPPTVEAAWAGYDPAREPLEIHLVREWREDGLTLRHVVYTVGTFKGRKARMAAFYGFPSGARNLPGLMHMHGGGQRAWLRGVKAYARRGYAVLSVNWGGRPMEGAKDGDENTDWGAVDPTQNNVAGYSNLLPADRTIDPFPSARNNNWFLLTIGCRRGITFLQKQPEVDGDRIGVFGHSMGGRLTGLVAGTDERVKAASPSVGGSGFLQTDLWGLPGSARRVHGDLKLFQRTVAGQAYLQRVRCPILFLSATNDFNAPMDAVERGMALVPHEVKRTVYAPHLNHRFTPETQLARPLWFDAHLRGRLAFPISPSIELAVDEDGVPHTTVKPDPSRPVERVELYYGYERDPRNRYWADARAQSRDGVWIGACPVFDLEEPLFVFANVHYRLTDDERLDGDPAAFVLSAARSLYPKDLAARGVRATAQPSRLIDDFARGFHDWYTLSWDNPHWWHASTRKLADPRWQGPRGARLVFEVTTDTPGNTLGVLIHTDAWRGYAGRKPKRYAATVPLEKAGVHHVALTPADFRDAQGAALADWEGITELGLLAGDKALGQLSKTRGRDVDLEPWRGSRPSFGRLRWEGGTPVRRPKPYPASALRAADAGHESDEFQKAIRDSIDREKRDAAR